MPGGAVALNVVEHIAADVEARTIGAATHDPVLDPGRSWSRRLAIPATPLPETLPLPPNT